MHGASCESLKDRHNLQTIANGIRLAADHTAKFISQVTAATKLNNTHTPFPYKLLAIAPCDKGESACTPCSMLPALVHGCA